MGSVCAPSYANLFMGQFGEHVCTYIKDMPLLYLRYIDDILMERTKEQLTIFIKKLNKNTKLLNLNGKFHCRQPHP